MPKTSCHVQSGRFLWAKVDDPKKSKTEVCQTVGQLNEMRPNTVGNACGSKLDTASQMYPSDSVIQISRCVKVVNLLVVLSTYEKTFFP